MNANVTARRDFIKLALAASSLPFIPSVGFASAFADDRTKWYREAKFGMFIHWGPYSLASVEASWPIMEPEPQWGITEAEYRALPQRFDPVKFDPKAWVRLARAAGQRYMVFTTKHHDGFCMFDSSYTDSGEASNGCDQFRDEIKANCATIAIMRHPYRLRDVDRVIGLTADSATFLDALKLVTDRLTYTAR